MPKNEDGEFELVLGNKQLLSMFFVVIILLGVFFVMGYIVGRNSEPLVTAEVSSAKKVDTKPLVVDSPVPKQTPEAEPPPPSKPVETAVEKPAEPKPEPPKPEPTKPSTSKSEPAPKREAAKAENPRPPAPGKSAQSNQPVAGQTYLQLLATNKHDADAYVDRLRKENFVALDIENPDKPGSFRVLVGPLAPGDVNKVKVELQAKGFPADAFRKKF